MADLIRRASPDEARVVADLWIRSRRASAPANPLPVHGDADIRNWFSTVVMPERPVWVTERAGAVIALLVMDGDWIDQLHVDPDRTGAAIGSGLMAVAKRERPDGLQLWTFQTNTGARRFYERHGFEAVEMTDGDNEERAPDVRYKWVPTTP